MSTETPVPKGRRSRGANQSDSPEVTGEAAEDAGTVTADEATADMHPDDEPAPAQSREEAPGSEQPKGGEPVTVDTLAELLRRVLDGQQSPRSTSQETRGRGFAHRLDTAQQRLALTYGAIRNASGFFGRSAKEFALVPSTVDDGQGTIEFGERVLPAGARTAVAYDARGVELQQIELENRTTGTYTPITVVGGDVDHPADVAWVEILDGADVPVRLSVPIHVNTGSYGGGR